jgi:hypothetical protein
MSRDPPFDDPLSKLASRIRFNWEFARKMTELSQHSTNLFYGEYVVFETRPSWSMEMQCWTTGFSQEPESMTVGMVLLSANVDQKVLHPIQGAPFVDAEIPF